MLHLGSQFPAHPAEVGLYLRGARQGRLHMGQDILRTYMLQKIGAREQAGRLVPCSAEQKRLSRLA